MFFSAASASLRELLRDHRRLLWHHNLRIVKPVLLQLIEGGAERVESVTERFGCSAETDAQVGRGLEEPSGNDRRLRLFQQALRERR